MFPGGSVSPPAGNSSNSSVSSLPVQGHRPHQRGSRGLRWRLSDGRPAHGSDRELITDDGFHLLGEQSDFR